MVTKTLTLVSSQLNLAILVNGVGDILLQFVNFLTFFGCLVTQHVGIKLHKLFEFDIKLYFNECFGLLCLDKS